MSEDATTREGEGLEEQASDLLVRCREAMGGQRRDGQERMCREIAQAIEGKRHIIVQAGTGTGKSLGYLAPVLALADSSRRVIISTATKALQRQLVTKDIPAVLAELASSRRSLPRVAALKGWSNYACRYKLNAGTDGDVPQGALFDGSEALGSELGRSIVAVREWAQHSRTGDRDDLEVPVSDRSWGHASISPRECPGDSCPFAAECFARQARARALAADVVVTNHALLGADALGRSGLLGDAQVRVIDEAHELIGRIRQAATRQLSPADLDALARTLTRLGSCEPAELRDVAQGLRGALVDAGEGLLEVLPTAIAARLDELTGLIADLLEDIPGGSEATNEDRVSRGLLTDVRETIDAMRAARPGIHALWVGVNAAGESHLTCAPIDVAGDLANTLLAEGTVVLTSATLSLGGRFDPVAAQVGLHLADAEYRGIDVGSPFDYRKQGILYVASHVPRPAQSGLSPQQIDELRALVDSAGGGVLGLFSSRLALSQASEALADIDYPLFVQGEDQLPALVRAFTAERDACLFGTLSLWQGVDVPGSTCRLVVIDRLPFPRPDDPLIKARSRAVEARGGSSFAEVSLTHAALLLAQGAGRLIRSSEDRGMVAVLDSRLARARYAAYLRSSLPPLWATDDGDIAHRALRRLSEVLAAEQSSP